MLFECLVVSRNSMIKKLFIHSDGPSSAVAGLQAQGYQIIRLKAKKLANKSAAYIAGGSGMSASRGEGIRFGAGFCVCFQSLLHWIKSHRSPCQKSAMLFTKEFSVVMARLMGCGLSVQDALSIVSRQATGRMLSQVVQDILAKINLGSTLSMALAEHPALFPSHYCSAIALGEKDSSLLKQLSRLGDYYTSKIKNRNKILKAIRYPLAILSFSFIVLFSMIYFLVPRLLSLAPDAGTSTASNKSLCWVYGASHFMHQHTQCLFYLAVCLFLVLFRFIKLPRLLVEYMRDILMHQPTIKKLINLHEIGQWSYHLALALECGTPLIQAVKQAALCGQSRSRRRQLLSLQQSIEAGLSLLQSATKSELFSHQALLFIKVGEASASLGCSLHDLSCLLQSELEQKLERCLSRIQPLLLLLLSILVTTIVAAIYMPLLQLGANLGT